jgi:hypothetical protein
MVRGKRTRSNGSRPQFKKTENASDNLRLTDPRDDKKRIEETKGGLLEDSYRWILKNSDFQQWRKNPEYRVS